MAQRQAEPAPSYQGIVVVLVAVLGLLALMVAAGPLVLLVLVIAGIVALGVWLLKPGGNLLVGMGPESPHDDHPTENES